MAKLVKTTIDEELEKGIKILDTVDAYKWALICSEHALTLFELQDKKAIDKALQTINNNLDNVSIDMAKIIATSLTKEAEAIKDIDTSLYYIMIALAHTVATLIDKNNAIYSAIYSGCAILEKTKDKSKFKQEKLYQLEKLEKFILMYQS